MNNYRNQDATLIILVIRNLKILIIFYCKKFLNIPKLCNIYMGVKDSTVDYI